MKKLFTIAAMIFAVAMTACTETNENPYDGAPEPVFTLSTSSIEVPQAGGNMEIPFTIDNPGEWAQLRATTPTAWIKNLAWDQEKGKITFTAPANNTDDPLTDGIITVAYNFKEYNISVTQLGIAYDYKWTVTGEDNVVGTYYGTDYESISNVTVSFAAMDGENYLGVGDLDLWLPYVNDYCFSIPAGTYTFDAEDSMEPGTIGNEYSYISTDVENEEAYVSFASGALEVTKDKWIARMFDTNGKSYRIECAIIPHIDKPYPMGLDAPLDLTETFKSMMMGYYYYGAEFGEGTHAYSIQMMDMMGAAQLVLWVVSDNADLTAETMPTGTFEVAALGEEVSGDVVGASLLQGSTVYYSYGTYMPNDEDFYYLWVKEGSVTITEDPEPNEYDATTYTFELDITGASHEAPKLTGKFSAECMFATDKTSSAPEAQAANFEAPAYPAKARR